MGKCWVCLLSLPALSSQHNPSTQHGSLQNSISFWLMQCFKAWMICKGNCWGIFATTRPVQGPQLSWASGTSPGSSGYGSIRSTRQGLRAGAEFCILRPNRRLFRSYTQTFGHSLLIPTSTRSRQEQSTHCPLCTLLPATLTSGKPGLSSPQTGPASPPQPRKSLPGLGDAEASPHARRVPVCSCSTEQLLQLLSTLTCQTP